MGRRRGHRDTNRPGVGSGVSDPAGGSTPEDRWTEMVRWHFDFIAALEVAIPERFEEAAPGSGCVSVPALLTSRCTPGGGSPPVWSRR